MSDNRRLDLVHPPAARPGRKAKNDHDFELEEEVSSSERRLALKIRRLQHDPAALEALLREQVPPWQRKTAHLVLVRELGAEEAASLHRRVFGVDPSLPKANELPPSARPGVRAVYD